MAYDSRKDVELNHLTNETAYVTTTAVTSSEKNRIDSKGTLSMYMHISFFAILGCLTRLGTDYMMGENVFQVESSSSVLFVSFFSNMLGCFVLGLLTASSLSKTGPYGAVATGISTGLCGSITTYSKWNQQVSLMLLSAANTSGQSQVIGFLAIMLGLATSLASYYFGKDVMTWMRAAQDDSKSGNKGGHIQSTGSANTCPLFTALLVVLIIVFALLAGLITENTLLLKFSLCAVFAPFGASLRYLLSKLNPNFRMPMGTMVANMLGSTLIALLNVLATRLTLDTVTSTVLSAIGSGFLACLTTVSTFMSEAAGKRDKGQFFDSNIYIITTLLACQVLAGIINGINVFVPMQEDGS